MNVAPHPSSTRAAAVEYARRGWPVFPVNYVDERGRCSCGKLECPRPGKHPVWAKGVIEHGVDDATIDTATVAAWWERWPKASIGLACGLGARAWVFDVDVKAPKPKKPGEVCISGVDALRAYEAMHGELPETLTARSGSGGQHRYFKLPVGRTIKNAVGVRGPNGERTGLDVRSTGGYIILPPSSHPSGGVYAWVEPGLEPVDAPAWLLDLVDPPAAAAVPTRPVATPVAVAEDSRERKYALAVLRGAVEAIQGAGEGARHDVIRDNAFNVGGFVRFLDRSEAEAALVAAGVAAYGGREREVRRAVASGLDKGAEKPREIPEPTRTPSSASSWEAPPPWTDDDVPHDLDRRARFSVLPPVEEGDGAAVVDLPTEALKREAGWTQPPAEESPLDAYPRINTSMRQACNVIDDAWGAVLAANQPPRLFTQFGDLVRIVRSESGAKIARCELDHVQSMLIRSARWMKSRKARQDEPSRDGYVLVDAEKPPEFVARDMLAAPHPSLPAVEHVVYAPTFAADGALLGEPGYHAQGRVWYEELRRVDPVPMTAAEARDLLLDWLQDFPFQAAHDRAHAIALFLLPFVRNLIAGPTPVHLVEAPKPRTGKTLLAKVLLSASMGQEPPMSPFDRDEREVKKLITSVVAEGWPVVVFDNVKGTVDSPSLEAVTTGGRFGDRLLGVTGSVNARVRSIWVFTANGAKLSTDLVGRTIRIRLVRHGDFDPRKDAAHPRIEAWTLEHHSALTSAAIRLVGEWLQAGSPLSEKTLGGYEDWAGVVGGILEVAGIPGFLEGREAFADSADPIGVEWRQFVRAWWNEHGTSHQTVASLRKLAADRGLLQSVTARASGDDAKISAFGRALAAKDDNVVAGFLVRWKKSGVAGYRLEDKGGSKAPPEDGDEPARGARASEPVQEEMPW